jgi:hypothetical protein
VARNVRLRRQWRERRRRCIVTANVARALSMENRAESSFIGDDWFWLIIVTISARKCKRRTWKSHFRASQVQKKWPDRRIKHFISWHYLNEYLKCHNATGQRWEVRRIRHWAVRSTCSWLRFRLLGFYGTDAWMDSSSCLVFDWCCWSRVTCFTVTLTSTTLLWPGATGSKLDLSSTMTATARVKTSFIYYVMCLGAKFYDYLAPSEVRKKLSSKLVTVMLAS